MANLEWTEENLHGLGAVSPFFSQWGDTIGATQESSVARLERLCAAGDSYACTLLKSSRTSGADAGNTPEAAVTRAQNRESQANAERGAIAARLTAAGVSPKIAQAVIAKHDVQYGAPRGALGVALDWVKAHPVITAIGAVATAGVATYVYKRRR